MISAPITPGTHPRQVRRNTISIEPQPRSYTASGGKIIANSTRKQDIAIGFSTIQLQSYKKILNYANIFEYLNFTFCFFEVCVPVHACIMTGEMQISLGLTCFQFAFALLLPSSHTRLGLKLEVL